MVKKKTVRKVDKFHPSKISSKEFMKHYLAFRYPVDHSHIQLSKGFIDFVLGLILGVIVTVIFIRFF